MTTIYRAGAQLVKVRAVMLLSLACAAGSLWWGWDLLCTYGSRPADGGVLAPLPVRLAWGTGVGSLGVIFAAGMWLYGRCYVASVDLDRAADELHVRTVRFLGTREKVIGTANVTGVQQHEGTLDLPDIQSVNAPWTGLRVAGAWLPLIVDRQGEFPEPDLASGLFEPKRRRSRS